MTRQVLTDFLYIWVACLKLSGASARRPFHACVTQSVQTSVPGLGVASPCWLPAEVPCSKLCACKQQDEQLCLPLLSVPGVSLQDTATTSRLQNSIIWRFRHLQAAEEHKRFRAEDDATVKAQAAQKAAFEPRWCERTPVDKSQIGKQYLYRYKGGYWEERAAKHKA